MPAILNNATNKPLIVPNEAPRSLRVRKTNPSSVKHSPDGYFAHDELLRAWRPLTTPDASIRTRSRTHLGLSNIDPKFALQDVEEEEATSSDPHAWRPPSKTDSRGPCPALGALSNHGYLPHDGRNITIWQMVKAIREGYGGSWAYAVTITIVSYAILRFGGAGKGWLWPTIDLEDLGAHGILEHDGSLTHADLDEFDLMSPHSRPHSPTSSTASSTAFSTANLHTRSSPSHLLSLLSPSNIFSLLSPSLLFSTLLAIMYRIIFAIASRLPIVSRVVQQRTHTYAPIRPSRTLIRELMADSASGTHLTLADVARARVRRSACTRPIPSRIIQQFADGEFAMTVDILGQDGRVELDVLRTWLEEERLPRGWAPTHVQGLWRTHVVTEKVRTLMEGLRQYRRNGREVRSVVYES